MRDGGVEAATPMEAMAPGDGGGSLDGALADAHDASDDPALDAAVGDAVTADAALMDAADIDAAFADAIAPSDAVGPDATLDAVAIDEGPADGGLDAGPPDATIWFDDFEDGTIDPWVVVGGSWAVSAGALAAGPSCVWSGSPCADDVGPSLVQSPPLPSGDRQYRLEVDFEVVTAASGSELLRFGMRPSSSITWVRPDGDAGIGGSYTPWFPDTMMLTREGYLNLCLHCFRPGAEALYEQFGSDVQLGVRYHAIVDVCATSIAMEVRRASDGVVVWSHGEARDARSLGGTPEMRVFVLGEGLGHSVDNVRVTAGCRL